MDASTFEILFKTGSTIIASILVYYLKGVRTDFQKLTENLATVSLNLQTLITKDTHKEEAIADLKLQVAKHTKDIGYIKIKIALLEQKQNNGE